jgi:hypothetical protein
MIVVATILVVLGIALIVKGLNDFQKIGTGFR